MKRLKSKLILVIMNIDCFWALDMYCNEHTNRTDACFHIETDFKSRVIILSDLELMLLFPVQRINEECTRVNQITIVQ